MQAFYDEAGESLTSSKAREWFRTSHSLLVSDKTRFKETLARNVKIAETSLLPALQKAAAGTAELIARYSQVGR